MEKINRRQFLYCSAAIASTALPLKAFQNIGPQPCMAIGPQDIHGTIFKGDAPKTLWKWSKEGFSYTKLSDNKVVCGICPNHCMLSPGDRSVCRSKVNMDGTLYSLTYGNPCSINVDPIEKKPLYHFKPGSKAFSLATAGCNFRCLNCQNWEISQSKPEDLQNTELFPKDAVDAAIRSGSQSIAYTYSEAITFFEYMIDIARIAKPKKIYNLLISNGYINTKPLLELCNVLDAANINLKSYDDAIYRKLNGGRLHPVLNTFKTLHEQKIHFEMTTLVVPGYIDDPEMIKRMCGWILDNLGQNYPLHFTRFIPRYKLNRLPPTPVSTLTQFRELAMKHGIRYVYVGNVPMHEGENTYCHNCHKLLIKRNGFNINSNNMNKDRCKFCNTKIPGTWI